MNTLITHIKTSTKNNCKTSTMKYTQTYIPTPKIKQKLKQLQAATNHFYRYGHPTLDKLQNMKQALLRNILDECSSNWDTIVKEATECHGNPALFWHKIKCLLGAK